MSYRTINLLLLIFVNTSIILFSSCSTENKRDKYDDNKQSGVAFTSSDPELTQAWEWAKNTALSYVREGDAVGPWYEAALPGRDAFCMRDVSHQTSGAAVLGLEEENINMLYRFAENISESKDWCSYWEINKDNVPAPVDYKNDKDFWYNLPANFDVMDACFRMFMWTGDSSYLSDSVFLNFYDKTLNEYTEVWNLGALDILQRDRIMNLPEGATKENHHYYDKRGIPGYHEGAGGRMLLGIDQLAVQSAANNWYNFKIMNGEKNSRWENEAEYLQSIISNVFWDDDKKDFRTILYDDRSFDYSVGSGQDFSHMLLHYNALNDEVMINSILDHYSEHKNELIIEIASHMPDIFFRYGRPDEGIYMLKHLTNSSTERREYPENPFSVIGAFATGLMGITPDAGGNYLITMSGLSDPEAWCSLSDLPVLGKKIDLTHYGQHTSVITNHSDKDIIWFPYLKGSQEEWYINEKPDKLHAQVSDFFGLQVTSWMITVPPQSTASVSAFPTEKWPVK